MNALGFVSIKKGVVKTTPDISYASGFDFSQSTIPQERRKAIIADAYMSVVNHVLQKLIMEHVMPILSGRDADAVGDDERLVAIGSARSLDLAMKFAGQRVACNAFEDRAIFGNGMRDKLVMLAPGSITLITDDGTLIKPSRHNPESGYEAVCDVAFNEAGCYFIDMGATG